MNNPSDFMSINQYNLWLVAVNALVISEIVIWMVTSNSNSVERRKSDRGTIWFIIVGWILCCISVEFFRSPGVPKIIRNFLIPSLGCNIGIMLIFLG